MRPLRRRSTRVRNKLESSGTSSEDGEQNKALNIINKLSRKYKKKENGSNGAKKKGKKAGKENEYDGDAETSAEQSDVSSLTQDIYNFDMAEEEKDLRLRLFTDDNTSPKKDRKSAQKDKKKLVAKKTPAPKKTTTNTVATGKRSRPFWASFTIEPKTKRSKTSTQSNTKKKTIDSGKVVSKPNGKKSKSSSGPKGKVQSPETTFVDSGVFMSPTQSLCSTGSMQGTPSIILAGDLSSGDNNPAYVYDDVVTPPSLSPVKRVSSFQGSYCEGSEDVPMDQGSPKLKMPLVETSYKHISLANMSFEERKKKKVPTATLR